MTTIGDNHQMMMRNDNGTVNVKNLSVILAFVLQLGVLIWGAAKLSYSVESLVIVTARLSSGQDELLKVVNTMQSFDAVTNIRIMNLESNNRTKK
jgi:hypothetical protein